MSKCTNVVLAQIMNKYAMVVLAQIVIIIKCTNAHIVLAQEMVSQKQAFNRGALGGTFGTTIGICLPF